MIAEALVKTTPLLFCALAFLLAWNAGLLNIGGEGQFLAGASAAALLSTRLGGPGFLLAAAALLAGAVAGGAWAGIAAWLLVRKRVLEVLSTLLLNFIAAGAVSLLVHGFLQERARTFPQSEPVPANARLTPLLSGSRINAGLLLALGLAVGLSLLLRNTSTGFRIRAVGRGPAAAAFAGIPVTRTRTLAFLASGALAGLGGAVELLGTSGRLFESFAGGLGYLGLAAAVVAGFSPLATIPVCLGFGAANAAGGLLQRRYGIPSAAVLVLEAGALLASLAAARPRRKDRQ